MCFRLITKCVPLIKKNSICKIYVHIDIFLFRFMAVAGEDSNPNSSEKYKFILKQNIDQNNIYLANLRNQEAYTFTHNNKIQP